MTVRAIIFDFDGVLVESVDVKGQAFAALYEQAGHTVQQQVLDFHNANGGMSRYDKIRYYERELMRRSPDAEALEAIAQKFSSLVVAQVIAAPWVMGALSFLENYGPRIPLFVASATPQDELRHIVSARAASDFFRDVLGTPQTKTQNIAHVLRTYGFSPEDVVMIGDARADYEAARANQVPFIGRVRNGTENIFSKDTPVLPDLVSLPHLLGFAP